MKSEVELNIVPVFQHDLKVALDKQAIAPTRAHSTDAGLDLYTPVAVSVAPKGSVVIDTGVHVELPRNTYGKIESKSGLNVNHGIVSCGGVIDEGYTGSIKVKLYNLGDKHYMFRIGDKIAQLIVQPCVYGGVTVVDSIAADTERGDNGFGSTGR